MIQVITIGFDTSYNTAKYILKKNTDFPQGSDTLYHMKLYRVHLATGGNRAHS